MRFAFVAAALSLCMSLPAFAQTQVAAPTPVVTTGEFGVPVFPYDITDRPYEVLGEVSAGVRKATIFSKSPSQEKIYKELWERGEKLGADAVIKAQYGEAHISAMSWGKTNATGVAIKFLSANSIAAPAAPAN